jgi:prevent-host-death family protein
MARRTWSLQDAKNRFSEVVEAARDEPQLVTKHGKPAVVVVAATHYEHLRQLERANAPSFVDHLLSMPTSDLELERMDVELREPDF